MTVLTLRPTSDDSRWSAIPGGTEYSCVDEVVASDDDYIRATTWMAYTMFGFPDHTTESGTINKVTLFSRQYASDTSAFKFRCNGNYVSADIAITTTPTLYSKIYTTNPATSAAWTWAEIDALTAGVRGYETGNASDSMCSQFYVEVDYTAAATIVIPVMMNQYRLRWA
jgi:hypothetical protein